MKKFLFLLMAVIALLMPAGCSENKQLNVLLNQEGREQYDSLMAQISLEEIEVSAAKIDAKEEYRVAKESADSKFECYRLIILNDETGKLFVINQNEKKEITLDSQITAQIKQIIDYNNFFFLTSSGVNKLDSQNDIYYAEGFSEGVVSVFAYTQMPEIDEGFEALYNGFKNFASMF